jgi:hypothetical protein
MAAFFLFSSSPLFLFFDYGVLEAEFLEAGFAVH